MRKKLEKRYGKKLKKSRMNRIIKKNLSQIFAITEKNLKLSFRFKLRVIITFITPILSILMPLIIMGEIFSFQSSFGPWTRENFIVFQFTTYNIMLLQNIYIRFPNQFISEKYWKTFPAIIIAPLNRFNILLGIIFSHLILISIPFIFLFIFCYIVYPISIITVFSILIIYFLITLIFSGIGLILGIFAISIENYWKVLSFIFQLTFWISCLTYPFDIFPSYMQNIIILNPFYYLFDVLRMTWIDDNIFITIISFPFHLFLLIAMAIIVPFIGILTFNKVYKKYGIVGY